jgi:DNA-directed RNA polymerase I and III subunit RPAC2
MAPALKEENTTAALGDQEERMEVDSASEVEEIQEENSDEEMDEEPDVAISADKLEIVNDKITFFASFSLSLY